MFQNLLSNLAGFATSNVFNYIKIGLACLLLFFVGYIPWHIEHLKFLNYKAEQSVIVQEQKDQNKAKEAQHTLIVKGIQDELAAKTIILRRYYSVGVRQPSTGTVLSGQTTPSGVDAKAQYTLLAGQCAETTLKYELLQKYERERLGLPDDE